MSSLFAYGTLMCTEIMAKVCGQTLKSSPAVLHDFQRYALKNNHYPGLVTEPGAIVGGVVYRNLGPQLWLRLDAFEGDEYERKQVVVLLEDATEVVAYTYLFKPKYSCRLSDRPWDYEHFLKQEKTRFKRCYLGFKTIKD